jgi:hypothetical protein
MQTLRSLISVVLLTAVFAGQSWAQDIDAPVTVTSRNRADYDATGLPTGGLRLYPTLALEFLSNSNVLATKDGEISDFAVLVKPGFEFRSDWTRHAFAVGADATIARYDDLDSEDYDDYALWTRGLWNFSNARLTGGLRYDDAHEPRTSPNARLGLELTEFSTGSLNLAYHYQPARFFVQPKLRHRQLEYDSTPTPDGVIDNSDRDRDSTELSLRLGYDVSPDYSVFAEARSTQVDYDQPIDNDGFVRDSDGFQLVFGSLIGLSDMVFGELHVGYLDWEYDDPRFAPTDGFTFGADITWNISQLTTLNVNGSQGIRATTVRGSSGIDQTRLGARVDHELLRNLVLSLNVSSSEDDFHDIDRNDDVFGAKLGGRYLMNRNLNLDFGYEYASRDTKPVADRRNEFDIDLFFVRINGQL